jgi:cobalamin synthase
MQPDLLGPWMLLLAAVFAISIVASHLMMRRARREPENEYFFREVSPAGWRDYRETITVVFTLALFGVMLCFFRDSQALSLLAMVTALCGLAYQAGQSKRFWMHSMLPFAETGIEQAGANPED